MDAPEPGRAPRGERGGAAVPAPAQRPRDLGPGARVGRPQRADPRRGPRGGDRADGRHPRPVPRPPRAGARREPAGRRLPGAADRLQHRVLRRGGLLGRAVSKIDLLLDGPVDVAEAADELMRQLMSRPWGHVSPSIYETGRLVTLAPWLVGHEERVNYLIETQRPDGAWGALDGYALVPTLSATEALLSTYVRGDAGADPAVVREAAVRGLGFLSRRLTEVTALTLPDTPAIEIIVPALVALINTHLENLPELGIARLPLPAGLNERPLTLIRQRLASGTALPEKLLHALEVAGDAAAGAPAVSPTPIGTIGASPAATAAWLGGEAR